MEKENLQSCQNSRQYTRPYISFGGKNDQICDYSLTHAVPNDWLDQSIKILEEHDWRIGAKDIWGRSMCVDLSKWAKDEKIGVSFVSVYQKDTSQRRNSVIK